MNNYDKFYAEGGFKYNEKTSTVFIETQTCIPKIGNGLSLLDIGSGDGFWSKILSNYCKSVTGIDVTEKGIEIAKQKLPTGKFLFQDALTYKEKHDIVFCRAVGIFNCFVNTDKFKNNLKHVIGLANKYFIFIEYSRPDLYNTFDGRWHHKHPNDVYDELKKYGESKLKIANNFMIIETETNNIKDV